MDGAALSCAFCCLVILQLAVSSHGQLGMCSDPPINYGIETYRFLPSTMISLTCDVPNAQQWWVSATPCGPFRMSDLCPMGNTICSFNATQITNQFYHCCTSGRPVEESLSEVGDSSNCVLVEICTMIRSETTTHPPIAYFGERLLVYVDVYAHPRPNETNQVFLNAPEPGVSGPSVLPDVEEANVCIFQPSLSEPIFTFEYSISVPSISESDVEAILFFSTTFQGECRGNFPSETARIRVINRGGSTGTIAPSTTLPSAATDGVQSGDRCILNTGLIGGIIILAVLLVALIITLSIIIVYLVYLVRLVRKYKKNMDSSSSENANRPNFLPMSDYSRLQSHDQTPSPAVLPYENYPTGQQPRQNGNHLQAGRVGQPAPQTPSSLALDSYRSHSGETPLISLTPSTAFPNAASAQVGSSPPASDQTAVSAEESGSQVSGGGHYATVGQRAHDTASPSDVGGAREGPIYNNTTIAGLASNVKLEGADAANQTNV